MQQFIPGQRWISEAESQLGLGTVLEVEQRRVQLVFMATGDTRTYARQTAPLSRVLFSPGDIVYSHQGWKLRVRSLSEHEGLVTYHGLDEQGQPGALPETELDSFIQLNRPSERLLNGQIDADAWFELRYQAVQHINRLCHSDLRGLTGVRTELIPHQLYIAHEVANRYAPRVLLADEVGLGKTIEAGLILHQQLLTERAHRVLILVPDSLVHQWLVEMLRRFNLHFSIYDEQRCLAIEEDAVQDNPFHHDQLVLCSVDFLAGNGQRLQQCLAGEWDLLVVDEAHHLQWSPEQASPEYSMVEQLAAHTRGVLLLTATPEQLGKQGHFARLRLLDSDRFDDFQRFTQEEQAYEPLARAIDALLNEPIIDDESREILNSTLTETDNRALLKRLEKYPDDQALRQQLVDHLLDRHGTGRVLFRNTRGTVQGFPQRHLHGYMLPLPDAYASCLDENRGMHIADIGLLLCPERLYQDSAQIAQPEWTRFDPRIGCLVDILDTHPEQKILVIAARAQTALDIAGYLKNHTTIPATVFHEGMSIVERDRASAWFADTHKGAQVLICSEIGSEGRNFQFAHHMVLFDLPLHPDLLEQRIGRLDRIGQTDIIHIHALYMQQCAQQVLFRWYSEGLGAFEHTCPAGHSVFTQLREPLVEALRQIDDGADALEDLISTARNLHDKLSHALHQGRDRLLEYNSCRRAIAETLKQRAIEQERSDDIGAFMEQVFDCFSIEYDLYRQNSFVIRPGDHMLANLPGLPEDGMAITYDRQTALANEDLHFLSWEHPLVTGALDAVLNHEQGNTALTAMGYAHAKPGSLLMECVFVLEAAAVESLQVNRYLPPTPLRILVDEQGNDHHDSLPHSRIKRLQTLVDRVTAAKIVQAKRDELNRMVTLAEHRAQQQTPAILSEAHAQSEHILQGEIDRLQALATVNPNIREAEIVHFRQQLDTLSRLLDDAVLRLDAIRVIVVTDE